MSRRTGIRPPTGRPRQKCQRCPAPGHPNTGGPPDPIRSKVPEVYGSGAPRHRRPTAPDQHRHPATRPPPTHGHPPPIAHTYASRPDGRLRPPLRAPHRASHLLHSQSHKARWRTEVCYEPRYRTHTQAFLIRRRVTPLATRVREGAADSRHEHRATSTRHRPDFPQEHADGGHRPAASCRRTSRAGCTPGGSRAPRRRRPERPAEPWAGHHLGTGRARRGGVVGGPATPCRAGQCHRSPDARSNTRRTTRGTTEGTTRDTPRGHTRGNPANPRPPSVGDAEDGLRR